MATTTQSKTSDRDGQAAAQRRAIRKALEILGAPELSAPISQWKDFVQTLERR